MSRRPLRRRARGAVVVLAALAVAALGFLVLPGHESDLGRVGGSGLPTGAAPPASGSEPVSGDGPPAQPAPGGEQFGANINRLFENPAFGPHAIAAQLSALHATGATIARTDALWEASEPAAPVAGVHHYDWTFDDRIAEALAAHGLRWLPVIDYTANWAQSVPGVDHSPPASTADYAAYAAAFADRYGPGGGFWSEHSGLRVDPVTTIEIWNEPDNPTFWSPSPAPGAYADLYGQARAAITAVRPSIRVIIGGLWHPAAFLTAVLAMRPGLRGHIDGVAIHPYGANPFAVLGRTVQARSLLGRLGLARTPLYVTEFGWTTSPAGARDYLPERLRPGYLAGTLAAFGRYDCGVAAVTAYTWVTEEQNPGDPEQWYGISPPGGNSSPDTGAFAAGLLGAVAPGRGLLACTAG